MGANGEGRKREAGLRDWLLGYGDAVVVERQETGELVAGLVESDGRGSGGRGVDRAADDERDRGGREGDVEGQETDGVGTGKRDGRVGRVAGPGGGERMDSGGDAGSGEGERGGVASESGAADNGAIERESDGAGESVGGV